MPDIITTDPEATERIKLAGKLRYAAECLEREGFARFAGLCPPSFHA